MDESREAERGSAAGGGRKGLLAVILALGVALAIVSSMFYLAVQPGVSPTTPGPLAAPTEVRAVAGDATLTVSWSPVEGARAYDLYLASVPGVEEATYASLADGAKYADVSSPYAVGGLQNGKTYYVRVSARDAERASAASAESSATPKAIALPPPPITAFVSALVEFDTGGPVVGAGVTVRTEDGGAVVTGQTGADGRVNLGITPAFPTRLLVEVTLQRPSEPSVTGFRWSHDLAAGGAIDVGRILLPDPANKELSIASGVARSADGRVVVPSFPPEVASIFAKPYEADAFPDAFPGDLAEGTSTPINNLVVLWISALDASGAQVFDLSAPATVRVAVPPTQWVDLEDFDGTLPGIQTPIYSMDYDTALWVREADGILTDADGNVLDASLEASIRTGTYGGPVFAEFRASHFSWWNVDKPPTDCGPDFGDAPDPTYPTRLASDGARHLNICRAWLGAWVDGEDDARIPNQDRHDDGVLATRPLKFRVSNWDWPTYLYINVLIDRNADGDWEDADEWVVRNLPASVPKRKGKLVETDVDWDEESWMRVTLTGSRISDYTGRGEFAVGETEDHPFLSYRLSVHVAGNGTVSSDPSGIDCRRDGGNCTADYRSGTTVALTAVPDPGESFVGWGGDCKDAGSNATCVVTMDSGRNVYATFTQPYYTLGVYVYGLNRTTNETVGRVTSEPPGIDCTGGGTDPGGTNGKGCTAVFPRGTNVTLTATPEPGWRFSHWGGQGSCTGPNPVCTLVMDSDKFVTAVFEKE